MAIHIILADTDEEYADRVERYMLSKGMSDYEFKKCSTKSELKKNDNRRSL